MAGGCSSKIANAAGAGLWGGLGGWEVRGATVAAAVAAAVAEAVAEAVAAAEVAVRAWTGVGWVGLVAALSSKMANPGP